MWSFNGKWIKIKSNQVKPTTGEKLTFIALALTHNVRVSKDIIRNIMAGNNVTKSVRCKHVQLTTRTTHDARPGGGGTRYGLKTTWASQKFRVGVSFSSIHCETRAGQIGMSFSDKTEIKAPPKAYEFAPYLRRPHTAPQKASSFTLFCCHFVLSSFGGTFEEISLPLIPSRNRELDFEEKKTPRT